MAKDIMGGISLEEAVKDTATETEAVEKVVTEKQEEKQEKQEVTKPEIDENGISTDADTRKRLGVEETVEGLKRNTELLTEIVKRHAEADAAKNAPVAPEKPTEENYYGFGSVDNFEKEYNKSPAKAMAKLVKGITDSNAEEFRKTHIDPELDKIRQPLEAQRLKSLHEKTFQQYPEFAEGTDGYKATVNMLGANPKLKEGLIQLQDKYGFNATEIAGILAYYPIMKAQISELRKQSDNKKDPTKVTAPANTSSVKNETMSQDEELEAIAKEHGITNPDTLAAIKRDALFGTKKKK